MNLLNCPKCGSKGTVIHDQFNVIKRCDNYDCNVLTFNAVGALS